MANRFIVVLILAVVTACTSLPKQELSEAENKKAKELLSTIIEINSSSPVTISSAFTADGNTGKKKFRVEGSVLFDKKGYYKVSLTDYVFKSPVIDAWRESDRLYFFYPAEKKLLIDDVRKIDLSAYTDFKADYMSVYTLLTGGIPLIEHYSIHKCLHDEKGGGYNLILENKDYFENIYFKGALPEKIMFIHKLTRNKAEIYLDSAVKEGKSVFFKHCRIVVPELNTAINLKFEKPVLNKDVTITRFNQEKLPKKTEIIRVN